jgi:membrane-associated phospholipid phosphatase
MRKKRPRLVAAEFVVLGFIVYCVARLALLPRLRADETRWFAFPSLAIVLSLLAAIALKAWRHRKTFRPRDALRDLRIWWPLLAMVASYPLVPAIIDGSGEADADFWLSRIDAALFLGHDPLLLAERLIHPALSEWMAFCYTSYGLLFILTAALFLLPSDERPARWFVTAASLTLAVGYVGYTLVPAVGPLFWQKNFTRGLDFQYMSELKAMLHDRPRIARDCFPSLHTAVTLMILYGTRRWLRRAFWLMLPIAATIPVACVYMRHHYVIDVVAGAALAWAVIAALRPLERARAA